MWKCHKCGKPVYFAERKQSLGYNWHPECLRCEECGKRLNPGQHAEHKGVPYCHVPCYGALFGPQLFGHGTRVESHKSFGPIKDASKIGNGPSYPPRSVMDSKLKSYNQFHEGKSGEIRSREVNGRLILEGPLRIYWGVQGVIHLKENDDQRTVVTVRKRNSCRYSASMNSDSENDIENISRDTSYNDLSTASDISTVDSFDTSRNDTGIESGSESTDSSTVENSPTTPPHTTFHKSVTLPSKLDVKQMEWDELDDLLQVERRVSESEKLYQTMPLPLPSQFSQESGNREEKENRSPNDAENSNKSLATSKDETTSESTKYVTKDDSWILNSNHLNRSRSGPDCIGRARDSQSPEFDRSSVASFDISTMSESPEEVVRRPKGSTAIRRRPGKRLSRSKVKRRCSINGHFYDRETSFFTPPHGSQMSVWITSLVNTQEVINLILEKYKVESDPSNFALFMIRDNGEQRRLKDDESPLCARVISGPHEDIAKLFLMDSHTTPEVSNEVAQFLNLSLAECRAILNQYYSQEEREVAQLKEKYKEMKRRILLRMQDFKTSSGL
ncbi:uncharacterized protein LOC123315453 [Coccinella septempunctata]|uniref:uncharacterized protein LOC123315453 n=1 Tax=Coccinella septempunctata TaxID=41139 RepID=UPI001D05CA64|nr:uncharacterized protein LOC123315453 [Coccinella septempunctata]